MDLDVNLADMFGATALMYASKQEPGEEVVRLLLERKDLDLDGKDGDGKTAEDYAAALSSNAVVQLIREERSRRMDWEVEEVATTSFHPNIIPFTNYQTPPPSLPGGSLLLVF